MGAVQDSGRHAERESEKERDCSVAIISQMDRVYGLYLISNYPVLFIPQPGGADCNAGFKMKMLIFQRKTFKDNCMFQQMLMHVSFNRLMNLSICLVTIQML